MAGEGREALHTFLLFPSRSETHFLHRTLVPTYEKPLASYKSPRLFPARRLLPSGAVRRRLMVPCLRLSFGSTSPQPHSLKNCLNGLFGEKVWQPASKLSPLVPGGTTDTNCCPEVLETVSCEVDFSQN